MLEKEKLQKIQIPKNCTEKNILYVWVKVNSRLLIGRELSK